MSTTPITSEVQPESPVVVHKHKSMWESAACLSVGREWPSLTKSLPKEKIQTTGDKKMFHASKDLYNSNHLKKLQNLEMALDSTLKRYASAPFPLKTGVYIIGQDLFTEIEVILAKHVEDREKLINAFVAEYTNEVAKAKEFQGDAFDPADYTTAEKVKSEFKFGWNWLTMDVADNLQNISKDILLREQKKLEEVWKDAREATRTIMRAQMAGMVSHLVERLTPAEGEKKKIFRNTVLDPLNEFIRTFNPRDITEDSELRNLVDKAKQLVNGVSPEDLRSNEALKASVQQGFKEIKAILDPMVMEQPDRDIQLEPEEETVTVQ